MEKRDRLGPLSFFSPFTTLSFIHTKYQTIFLSTPDGLIGKAIDQLKMRDFGQIGNLDVSQCNDVVAQLNARPFFSSINLNFNCGFNAAESWSTVTVFGDKEVLDKISRFQSPEISDNQQCEATRESGLENYSSYCAFNLPPHYTEFRVEILGISTNL